MGTNHKGLGLKKKWVRAKERLWLEVAAPPWELACTFSCSAG